jgi:hypothetical protein
MRSVWLSIVYSCMISFLPPFNKNTCSSGILRSRLWNMWSYMASPLCADFIYEYSVCKICKIKILTNEKLGSGIWSCLDGQALFVTMGYHLYVRIALTNFLHVLSLIATTSDKYSSTCESFVWVHLWCHWCTPMSGSATSYCSALKFSLVQWSHLWPLWSCIHIATCCGNSPDRSPDNGSDLSTVQELIFPAYSFELTVQETVLCYEYFGNDWFTRDVM